MSFTQVFRWEVVTLAAMIRRPGILALLSFLLLFPIAQAQENKPKVGLVLSGGGAKGYAHIGALKVLEEAGVKIDYVGGTSIGAILGGLYASGYSAAELEEIMYSVDLTGLIMNEKSRRDLPLFDKTYREKYILELPFDQFKLRFPNALSTGQGTTDELTYLFRHVHDIDNFDELPIPFLAIATRLDSGEGVVFREGYLPLVTSASGAYPTLLEPVIIDSVKYIDGGVRNNYPVKEVMEMGADYIIGIDLQTGLLPEDELNSAAKVIEQTITYNIVEKSAEQSQLVDLSIKPDLKGYTVTSFDEKESIINAGRRAAEEVLPQLKEIAALQGYPEISHPPVETGDYILVTDLEVNGLQTFNRSFVKGKLGIETPQLVSFSDVREGIKRLYSSGNFEKVIYRFRENEAGHKTLEVDVMENTSRQSLKFGLHYDDLYKTGLLINFSSRNVVVKNSILSADIVLGDFPRYQFNYFIDNGVYPSFGFSSVFNNFNAKIDLNNFTEDYGKVRFDYHFREFLNSLYVQSSLRDKFAIGVGLQHQYLEIYTKNLPNTDAHRHLSDSYYIDGFGFIRADNRDNPNFPRRGIKFSGTFKYLFSSNDHSLEDTSVLSAHWEVNQMINRRFSIQWFGQLGSFMGANPPVSQKFFLGGFFEQHFLNYSRFYGLRFLSAAGDHLLTLGTRLQARFLKNHYVSGFANVSNLTPEFEDIRYFKYKYTGYGFGYGYDSPVGPIHLLWTYSPNTKKGLFNVSLGFWF